MCSRYTTFCAINFLNTCPTPAKTMGAPPPGMGDIEALLHIEVGLRAHYAETNGTIMMEPKLTFPAKTHVLL